MYLRYWKENGKATVIENVDKLVFDSVLKLEYRTAGVGRYDWHKLRFGFDYLEFTMSED